MTDLRGSEIVTPKLPVARWQLLPSASAQFVVGEQRGQRLPRRFGQFIGVGDGSKIAEFIVAVASLDLVGGAERARYSNEAAKRIISELCDNRILVSFLNLASEIVVAGTLKSTIWIHDFSPSIEIVIVINKLEFR